MYGAFGTYVATLVVTNANGSKSDPASTTVTITNLPPTVSADNAGWAAPGQSYNFYATITDGGNDYPYAYTVDWGDQSSTLSGNQCAGGDIPANHA